MGPDPSGRIMTDENSQLQQSEEHEEEQALLALSVDAATPPTSRSFRASRSRSTHPILMDTTELDSAAASSASVINNQDDILGTFLTSDHGLTIDGIVNDNATIASVLYAAKQRLEVTEITLRNVDLDHHLIAEATVQLFTTTSTSTTTSTDGRTFDASSSRHQLSPHRRDRREETSATARMWTNSDVESSDEDDQLGAAHHPLATNEVAPAMETTESQVLESKPQHALLSASSLSPDAQSPSSSSSNADAQGETDQQSAAQPQSMQPTDSLSASLTQHTTTANLRSRRLHRRPLSPQRLHARRRRRLSSSPISKIIIPTQQRRHHGSINDNNNLENNYGGCRVWKKIEILHCTGSIGPMMEAAAASARAELETVSATPAATREEKLKDPPPSSNIHKKHTLTNSPLTYSSCSSVRIQQLWFTGNVPIAYNPRYSLDGISCGALRKALVTPTLSLTTLSLKGTRLDPPGLIALCDGLQSSQCLYSLRLSHCAILAMHVRSTLGPALAKNKCLQDLVLAHCKLLLPPRPPPQQRQQERPAEGTNQQQVALENEASDGADVNDYMVPIRDAPYLRPNRQPQRQWRRARPQQQPERSIRGGEQQQQYRSSRNVSGSANDLSTIEEEEEEEYEIDDGDEEQDDCLSDLLEGLKEHPTLKILTIHGMTCTSRAMSKLAEMLMQPTTRLIELGLKNNVAPEDRLDILPLCRALKMNSSLQTLQLVGNNLTNEDMALLSRTLFPSTTTTAAAAVATSSQTNSSDDDECLDDEDEDGALNSTLATLNLTANQITDEGLEILAAGLAQSRRGGDPQGQHQLKANPSARERRRRRAGGGLRRLNVQRNPFTKQGQEALIASLTTNVDLERLDMDGTYHGEKAYYLNLNRGGRRLLLVDDDDDCDYRHDSSSGDRNGGGGGSVPLSLWPIVLGRANRINFGRHPQQRHAQLDVLYCLLRDGPALLQRGGGTGEIHSISTTTPISTRGADCISEAMLLDIDEKKDSNHDADRKIAEGARKRKRDDNNPTCP